LIRASATVAALLLAACCPRSWPKALAPLPDSPTVLRTVERERRLLANLSGTAKVDAFTRQGRMRVREVMVVERGGRLRFETLSPFEQPISTLVCDGRSFALYELRKKKYYQGPATPKNVSRLLPIELPPAAIAQILLGDPPLIAHDAARMSLDRCKTHYVVTLLQNGGPLRQELRIDAERLVPVRSRVLAGKELLYEVRFDRHQDLARVPLPRRIRFLAPRDKVDILVLYDEVDGNEKIEDSLFQLEIPRGVTVERVD